MALLQIVVGDVRPNVVYVMQADVARKPLENFRQLEIRAAFERDSHMIEDTFTVLQEGLARVSFFAIMQLAYNKYAMQVKMRSRSSI